MLIDDYINYVNKYKNIYEKCLVLMQVGSFYELYGYGNEGTDVEEICKLIGIQSTKKSNAKPNIDKTNPRMGGFPLPVLDKYLDILMEEGYTVIIVDQVTPPPEPKRNVTRILSPATRDIENQIENNYLMCLYFTTGSINSNKFLTGSLSYIDINTNECFIYETNEYDTIINLEDMYKTILNNKPSEILIFTDSKTKLNLEFVKKLEQFIIQLPVNCIHNKLNSIVNEDYFKLTYQTTLLKKVFKNTGILSVIEFLELEKYPLSVVCFCYLIQFIYEHNENIIYGINKPKFLDNIKYLSLINNVVENLNIISREKTSSKNSCILNLLNNCKTPSGKRYFKNCLLNPLTNKNKIEERYNITDYFIKNDYYKEYRDSLKSVYDLEKLFKKLIIKTLSPSHFCMLFTSLQTIKSIYEKLNTNNCEYIENLNMDNNIYETLKSLITFIEEKFNFDEMIKVNLNNVNKNLFKKDIYPELDNMQKEINSLENIFENVCDALNEGNMSSEFKLDVSTNKKNDKILRTISVTKNRYENILKDNKRVSCINSILKQNCDLTLEDIKVESLTAKNTTNLKVIFKDMDYSQIKLIKLQNKFKDCIIKTYLNELEHIYENFGTIFNSITSFICHIDFFCNNVKNALDNCYTRPIIKNSNQSYIKAEQIRHPLIEIIQNDVPYIANDIEIGTDSNKGMLLYGINSVGKSSYMKSIGVNLILAQAGMFVSSKTFEFCPYEKIFSRIPSGDNILKGKSTFVSEINEMRTILKRGDTKSLIIGDEMCSGTENVSSISLVASGVSYLSKKNASFIFATHLHELCELNSIKELNNVNIFHLSMHYDKENNFLVFDRILKPGNGDNMYGLEIAKSLDLPSDFLYSANQIKQEYLDIKKELLEHKKSKYSSSIYIDTCNICKKNCTEVHHITEQQYANKKGILEKEQIHKNRNSNLLPVCEDCHNNIHNKKIEIEGYKQTTDGIKLNTKTIKENTEMDNIKNRCIELRNKGTAYTKIHMKIKEEFTTEVTLYKIKQFLQVK